MTLVVHYCLFSLLVLYNLNWHLCNCERISRNFYFFLIHFTKIWTVFILGNTTPQSFYRLILQGSRIRSLYLCFLFHFILYLSHLVETSSRPFTSFKMSLIHVWVSSFSVEVLPFLQITTKIRRRGSGKYHLLPHEKSSLSNQWLRGEVSPPSSRLKWTFNNTYK